MKSWFRPMNSTGAPAAACAKEPPPKAPSTTEAMLTHVTSMSTTATPDIGPLTWVKGEIDLALDRTLEALARDEGEGATALQSARMHLHQARGALSIVGLDGVRDSAQYSRTDPFNLQQIEVYNGANSVFNGSGSVGGGVVACWCHMRASITRPRIRSPAAVRRSRSRRAHRRRGRRRG